MVGPGFPTENRLKISNEYLRGLIEGEGCFTFDQAIRFSKKLGMIVVLRRPAFVIAMHIRDKELLLTLCNRLHLSNEVYEYQPYKGDGANRGPQAKLIVREYLQLRDKVVPFFYKRLHGNKARQFESWLETVGSDPRVTKKFRTIYYLYKSGYYDNFPGDKFWEKYDVIKENINQENNLTYRSSNVTDLYEEIRR